MNVFALAIRFLLGALLLYSGLAEIRRPFDFLASVHAYQLTGPLSGIVVAGLLPWLEVVVGVCLVTGILTRGAFIGAIVLTGTFCFAISSAWVRGLAIGCGCFGDSSTAEVISGMTVARAVALVTLAVLGLLLSVTPPDMSPPPVAFDRPSRWREKFFNFHVSKRGSAPQSIAEAATL